MPHLAGRTHISVAIYVLLAKTGCPRPAAYVGETVKLVTRMKEHTTYPRNADVESALILLIREPLSDAARLRLETLAIWVALNNNAWDIRNKKKRTRMAVRAPEKRVCSELMFLLMTSAQKFTTTLFGDVPSIDTVFAFKGQGYEARGTFDWPRMRVLEGSVAAGMPTLTNPHALAERRRLVSAGVCKDTPAGLLFLKDHVFRSPGAAAKIICGHECNGWTVWRTADGRSIDAVYRSRIRKAARRMWLSTRRGEE
jgi:hypothetical protein